MVMSSEKFEDLEEEFRTVYSDAENSVKYKLPRLAGEQRKQELRSCDRLLEDAKMTLNSMLEEAQMAPGAYRSSMMSKVRGYQMQMEKIKKEIGKQPSVNVGREELFGLNRPQAPPMSQQDSRLIEGLDSLNRSSASVGRSQRIAAETDEIGVQIIGDLESQRDSLVRSRDRVKETDQDLTRSRKILNGMAMRVATNKILLICVIIVELIILGAVIYLRFIK